MGISTFVLGQSGSGKSSSLEKFNPDDVLLIRVVSKPLPFRFSKWKKWDSKTNKGTIIDTDNMSLVEKIIAGAKSKGKKIIIVDDMQYLMSNEFMKRSDEKGWD